MARPVSIYEIMSIDTGLSYIGITSVGVRARWNQHVRDALRYGKQSHIARALRKFEPCRFIVTQIAVAPSRPDAEFVERTIIADRETQHPNGYNLTPGGDGGCAKGCEFSEDHRKKLSAAARGRKFTDGQRRLVSLRQMGRKQSAELIKKRADAVRAYHAAIRATKPKKPTRPKYETLRGVPRPANVRQKISATHRARLTEDIRRSMSERWRLHYASPGAKEKMSAAKKAAVTPEFRARMSEILHARWAAKRLAQIGDQDGTSSR